MSKSHSWLICTLFVLFIGGGLALHLLSADQTFSPTENRFLANFPKLSTETVKNGEFMEDFETYTTDQFPLRDLWVSAKAWTERLTGKGENNGIYLGADDTLIGHIDPIDDAQLDKVAGYLNSLGEKVDVPVYFGLIPSAAEIWQDKLPTGAPTADEQAAIDTLYGQLTTLTPLDISGALAENSRQDIYYRTDHHWSTLGAYYGYTAIVEGMGLTPTPLSQYTPTVVSSDFYGTSYSSSGVRWLPADEIVTYVPEEGRTVTSYFTGSPVAGSLYVESYLAEKDKYSFFLGGNQPLCVITTEHSDKPSVLVVRDSYSDCLAPFLTENFSEIHLLDLRYFNGSVSAYLEMTPLDNVVVLYSVGNFVTDVNLFKLSA